ncbi:MAG: thiamine phosphate synthase [Candidatus Hydrogenedentota bacterium]
MDHSARMEQFDATDLYVVITAAFCAGREPLDVLEGCLAAGVRLVQLREKNESSHRLYEQALAFRERTRAAGALLIVDDRLDIAMAADADGVHLGGNDLPVTAARRVAPGLIIGASSHNPGEAQAAQAAGASYVNIGPIFATETKAVATGPVGPDMIRTIAPHLRVPFTCMGGIKAHNIGHVLARGARHPAVVTAVTAADNPEQAARELREKILAVR